MVLFLLTESSHPQLLTFSFFYFIFLHTGKLSCKPTVGVHVVFVQNAGRHVAGNLKTEPGKINFNIFSV